MIHSQQKTDDTDKEPIAWCFGYGSLVFSYAERAKFVEASMTFRRVWNAWNTKARATFLGLEKTKNKTTVTGVVYPIYTQKEVDELDLREQGYDKYYIDSNDVKVVNEGITEEMRKIKFKLDKGVKLFTYVPREGGNKPTAWFPIVQSYIDLCANGFLKFRKEGQLRDETDPVRRFLDTTFGWSEYMLNDRVLARRPWKYESNHFVIDDYLDDEDDVHDIPAALYPSDFAVKYFDEIKLGMIMVGSDRVQYTSDANFGM